MELRRKCVAALIVLDLLDGNERAWMTGDDHRFGLETFPPFLKSALLFLFLD